MRPTPDDVLTALDLISARVPDRHVSPDPGMAVGWLEDLVRYERAAVLRAARTWNGLRFPSTAEFVAEVQAAQHQIALEEAAAHSRGELPTTKCPEGCDGGWVLSSEEHRGVPHLMARPCELCAPVGYAVWKHRASHRDLPPEHCADCLAVKRGKDPLPDWLLAARAAAVTGARDVRMEERF